MAYLQRGLHRLSAGYVSLDASRPWLCYWILHSLDLLDVPLPDEIRSRAVATIAACQHPLGGFGGGPDQIAHLACTFAAVAALAIVGTAAAYECIDRDRLLAFLLRMKQPDGSFTVHDDGEVDVRGSYCAIATAGLLGVLTPPLRERAAEFIGQCQTYEGGLGAVPFAEAHAGYTYCGVAALAILGELGSLPDLPALGRFVRLVQCPSSGGFRGRTNKLVDGCYSFWTGALAPLLRCESADPAAFDAAALQKYILICCQSESVGGLRDKPGKYASTLAPHGADRAGQRTTTTRATV